MNWQAIAEALGVFGIGSGLIAWLIRGLIKHALDKDLKAFENRLRVAHETEIEEAKNRFTVGATSHMANVLFDKHVAFCEAYATEALSAMEILFRKGPTQDIFRHEAQLLSIRKHWALWLPPELEMKLDIFQANLRMIGAYAPPSREGGPPSVDVKKSYNAFAAAMGWPEFQGEKVIDEGAAAARAITELSKVLGVLELTSLRARLMRGATGEGIDDANRPDARRLDFR